MVDTAPMSTLEQVKAWLAQLTPQTAVEVSSSLFDAKLVNALFGLLAEPISLSITAVDSQNATLTGTATVLGEADTGATLRFTQPQSELLCELELALPSTVEWKLLSDFEVAFGGLAVTFVPDGELGVVSIDLAAVLRTETNGRLSIPVELSIPSFDGDWCLTGNTTSVGSLPADALTAIAGGISPTSILVPELAQLNKLQLNGFEVAFNPTQGTCALIGIALGYKGEWQFFDGKFEVEEIDLAFEVLEPFTQSRSLQAQLDAKMKIGSTHFDVGGRFPDKAVWAQLVPGSTLSITEIFEFFDVNLPKGFPSIKISTLAFVFFTVDGAFDFQIGIDEPVPIIGSAKLDNFFFDIGATYEQGTGITPAGQLHSQFSIGAAKLLFSGSYSQAGIELDGEVDNVHIDDVLAKLEADFGVTSVPAPIRELTLEKTAASLDTSKGSFSFECQGSTEVADVEVAFSISIKLTETGGKFGTEFDGELVLKTAAGRELQFDVTFSETHADTWILAEYKGTELRLSDLAEGLGLQLPSGIPSELDLGLSAIGFFYDFTSGGLALGAQSQRYGAATLVTLPLPPANKREFFFILAVGTGFSLSNLPLVGHDLAQIEEVEVSELQVVIASNAANEAAVKIVNEEIERLKSAKYPKLPPTGLIGTLVLAATLELGTDQLPLNVSLGGAHSEPARIRLATPVRARDSVGSQVLPGPVAGEAPSVTWFSVQKSFGPVSIQRIGVMYQSQTEAMWFELDADLAFGPLALSLAGLGFGTPLKSFSPSFSLQGLGVSYNEPPLEVAGGLVNLAPPGATYVEFEGGLVVGASQFKLQAFGYYGDQPGFPSMFVFGDISYPFGGPPAFFLTGVALGFGYNSNLRIPTIEQVSSFPFVVVLPGSTAPDQELFGKNPTPLDVLKVVRNTQPPWVTAQAGSLWLAAGLTFTSFELVKGQALVIVEVGDQLVLALVGTASAQFPQLADQSKGVLYANVELDILIRFAPTEGVFSVQAVLAKSSFLLDRACVLTGGFAFFVWFGANPHAGDFVLTLGGYNAAYTPPAHYPAVPAVGFHWSVDDSITVSGGAYLALTPAVLMAGGRLDATYQSGNLKAWFDAHADVLIRWKPFWIDAGIGIMVGASYKLDLFGTSHTVSVELGCDLELWGPPTGGSVTIDWYIIKFTIEFGSPKGEADKIKGWSDVEAMLPNTGTTNGPRNVLALTPVDGLVTQGTSPAPPAEGDSPAGVDDLPGPEPWTVRAGRFAFEASTSIPVSTATVGSAYAFAGDAFDVHPLGWKNIASAYQLAISDESGRDFAAAFQAARVTRSVPASLWGSPPEGANEPQVPAPDEQLVPGQILGVSIRVHEPQIGASAGPIDVDRDLRAFDLQLPGAQLPLSGSAVPEGDVPVNSPNTVELIADPSTGIASVKATEARGGIYGGLLAIGYVVADSDDAMGDFATEVECALAAEPLLVA